MFTGAGATDYICGNMDEDDMWNILTDAAEKNSLIGCGTHGSGNDKE
jgi:hypothetical protein